MEIAIGIVLGIAALATLIAIGRDFLPDSSPGREDFRAIHGRYPTDDEYEDPIA